MISVYPFASGSLYTASYAVSTSFATSASFVEYVFTASNAGTVLFPVSGPPGKGICLLTEAQFNYLFNNNLAETCDFPPS